MHGLGFFFRSRFGKNEALALSMEPRLSACYSYVVSRCEGRGGLLR